MVCRRRERAKNSQVTSFFSIMLLVVSARGIMWATGLQLFTKKTPSRTFPYVKGQKNQVLHMGRTSLPGLPSAPSSLLGKDCTIHKLTRSHGVLRTTLFSARELGTPRWFSFTFTACGGVVVVDLCYERGHGHFFLKEAPSQGNQGGLWC